MASVSSDSFYEDDDDAQYLDNSAIGSDANNEVADLPYLMHILGSIDENDLANDINEIALTHHDNKGNLVIDAYYGKHELPREFCARFLKRSRKW